MSTRWNWRSFLRVIIPVAAFPLFVLAAHPTFTLWQRILAWGIFVLGTAPALRLFERPVSVPLVELVGIQYVFSYATSIFYDDRLKIAASLVNVSSGAITTALVATLLAVAFILLGYEFARRSFRIEFSWIKFPISSSRAFSYGVVLVVLPVALQMAGALGQGGMGPLEILAPRNFGLALLAGSYYSTTMGPKRRVLVYTLFALSIALGLLGGMMQTAAEPFIIWALARFIYTRRAPIFAGLAVVLAFFVLQPVKIQYRVLVGSGLRDFTATEALGVYGTLIGTLWRNIGSDPAATIALAKESASTRLSWLQSTAWYVQLTPHMVPYHGARTLLYPLYSFVPRVIWPDKPIAQEANKILPVEYGFQSPDNLDKTMWGVGHVPEVFTAFGLAGIMPIFFVIGMFYALPQLMLRGSPSLVTVAMLLWLAVNMMNIGSTVGMALGGVLQQILVQSLLLRFFTEDRRKNVFQATPALSVASH